MTHQNFVLFGTEVRKNYGVTVKPATMQRFAEEVVLLQHTVSSELVATILFATIECPNWLRKVFENV